MADELKFSLTLTGPQMDFIGKFVVDSLNAANAQAKMASEVYQVLRAAVAPAQPKPPPASSLTIVQSPEPGAEEPPASMA